MSRGTVFPMDWHVKCFKPSMFKRTFDAGLTRVVSAVDAIVTSIKDVNSMKAFHWLLCLCLMMGAVGCTAESDTSEAGPSAVDVIEGTEEVDPASLLEDEPEAETTEESAETSEGEETPAEESDN